MENVYDIIVWVAMILGALLIIPFFIAVLHELIERWRKKK